MTTTDLAPNSSDPILGALERFPPVRGHLDAATSGVPPLCAAAATRDAVAAWAEGRLDGPAFDVDVRRSREAFARIVGVPADDVACGGAVSVFAGLVAAAVPAGGEVLFATGDFTSVVFPMLAQEPRGVRVRELPLEQIPEAIDARTSLVAVSAVQSADGRVLDLDALAGAAEHHGTDVLLDVTQAAGWLPIDASRFTFVCAGAYKWLLSPRGTALMAVRPEAVERLIAHTAGWYAGEDPWSSCYGSPLRLSPTAKRFDVSPAWLCWAGTAPSLELIDELGPAAIGAYDLALAARLRRGLGMPPSDSPIVVADHTDAEARLQRAGVKASVRAGRVRLSCHLPATVDDVDLALTALT
jgi:selenocysteine lyase/cysteine desulfurase